MPPEESEELGAIRREEPWRYHLERGTVVLACSWACAAPLTSYSTKTDFLKLYSTYVNNYPTALQTLNQMQQENQAFAQFIRRCEEKPECGFQDLPSLLIQPIQRIPRYEMLLLVRLPIQEEPSLWRLELLTQHDFPQQDLLRKTSEADKTYMTLAQAVEKIKDTAEYINEQKREEENMEHLRRLEKQIIGRRDFVRSVSLTKPEVILTSRVRNSQAPAEDSSRRAR